MQLAMILHVWAMHSQSKLVLGILFTFYALEMISGFIYCVVLQVQTIQQSSNNESKLKYHFVLYMCN